MTIDSFNKDDNVIRQSTDRLQGSTPIFLVQAARPVLILDEPQNMESERSIYDYIVCDSQTERTFVDALEHLEAVLLYLKLPNWFKVPTPVGNYNPDWAIVMEDRDEFGDTEGKPLLYLVRETKSELVGPLLRDAERQKVHCGERHFVGALGVDFKVVRTVDELI
jgi:type III restriction enzyme